MVEFLRTKKLDVGNYSRFEYSLITSLCGIHGTVTLATALMIPLTLESTGEAFPLRDAILFIASCVVLLSMIIGTIFLPLTIKSEDEETNYLNNAHSKILGEVINELEDKYKDKLETTPERMGYAIAIKKLQEQQIYFCEDERNLVRYNKKLAKLVEKKEQKKINEVIKKYDNNKYLLRIFEIRKWRIKKLVTYSATKQLFIALRLSTLESKFRRLLVIMNLSNQEEPTTNPHLYERRLRRRMTLDKEIQAQIQLFRNDMEKIFDTVTYNAMDILEAERNKENSLIVDFLKNVYDNFDYTLYNVPSDSYIEESRRFETEAIALQKEKILKLREDDKLDHHEADTLLRDLNYNEALLYTSVEE